MSRNPKKVDIVASGDYYKYLPGDRVFSAISTGNNKFRFELFHFPDHLDDTPTPALLDYAIGINLSGSKRRGNCRVGGKLYKSRELIAGQSCTILPRLQDISWSWRTDLPDRINNIAILYLSQESFAQTVMEVPNIDPNRVELLAKPGIKDTFLTSLGKHLNQELQEGNPFGQLYIDTAAQLLAVHLLAYHSSYCYHSKSYRKSLDIRALKRVKEYIMEHLSDDVRLATLAAIVGISAYHFARLFKQSTGLSPHQYVLQCRMEKAKQLLCETGLTLQSVAEQVGYTSANHFINLFHRSTGLTPAAYRKVVKI